MCEQGCQSNTCHSHHLWKGAPRLTEALIKINERFSRRLVREVYFVICSLRWRKTKQSQNSRVFTVRSNSNPPATDELGPDALKATH